MQLGTWSVCPTSKAFKPNRGTADEHLALGIRAAKALGSPVIRVVLGTWEDRLTDGGIDRHIESLLGGVRAQRSRARSIPDVKIAIENHAGDMHSTELAKPRRDGGHRLRRREPRLGQRALDAGGSDRHAAQPRRSYIVTTSLRDGAVWETPNGAAVAWTAMGEGQIDLKNFFIRFDRLCPTVPVHIETISGFNRELPYKKPEFWKAWPNMPEQAFAHFKALAKKGMPVAPYTPPAGQDPKRAEQSYQLGEIERSIHYCKTALHL